MTATYEDRIRGLTTAVAYKAPCRLATTGNITLYGLQTIDGVAVTSGDRVLVKDQTTAANNGIYTAGAGDWTRTLDFNGQRDIVSGTQMLVTAGTTNAGRVFRITTANPITIGTTSLSFSWDADEQQIYQFATVSDLLAYDTSNINDGDRAIVDEYYSGIGHGGGTLVWDASSTETADSGLIFGSGTGRWKRPEAAGNGPFKLSWWGIGGGSAADIAAFKAAVKALYLSECTLLDCEGVKLAPNAMIEIDNDNTNIGSGVLARSKHIANLNVRAVSGSWVSGDSVLYFHGDDAVSNLRTLTLTDLHIGANDLVDYGLSVSGYYHVDIVRPKIRDFLEAGIFSSREYSDSTGNHGLTIVEPDVFNGFGEDVGIGILLEDGDAVVQGGKISWTGTGIKTLRGGCVINGVHFSLADSATDNSKVGVDVVSPRQVTITTCDFDGCGIAFRNDENDVTGVPTENWYGITITQNDFGFAGLTLAQDAVITFLTTTADTDIAGLTILANEIGANGTPIIDFSTSGSGTWETDWTAIINNSFSSTGQVPGNTPGGEIILGHVGNARLVLSGTTGSMILRTSDGSAELVLQDTAGSAGSLPAIESVNGIHNRLRAGSTPFYVELRGDSGTFRPFTDASQNCGGPSNRWANGYFAELTLASLTNAADDAAAATAGVAIGEVYRNGSSLRVRVS